jgi:hypothetical protein
LSQRKIQKAGKEYPAATEKHPSNAVKRLGEMQQRNVVTFADNEGHPDWDIYNCNHVDGS